MSVYTVNCTDKPTGDKYSLVATVADSHVTCVNIAKGKHFIAIFTETHFPEECRTFDNFKCAMRCIEVANKIAVKFIANGTQIKFACNKHNNEFAYEFAISLQPFIPRTNAIILAEIETYMKSIDNQLQQLFMHPEEHCTFFGFDLVEKKESINVDDAIRKIVEISGLTKEEFMNKPQFCVFIERLTSIKQMHEKFVGRIRAECNKFYDTFSSAFSSKPAVHRNLMDIVSGMIEDCLTDNDLYIEKITVNEYDMGKLVDFNIKTNDFCVNVNAFDGYIDSVTCKIVAKIVSGELLPDVPRFIVHVGKFDKMIFGKHFDNGMVLGQNSFDVMLNAISALHPDLSPSVIQTAFKYPTANGILIDEHETLNEMQQHIVTILNEKYDEWAKQNADK